MKNKESKTLEMLNHKERLVYELCKEQPIALNSNTMLCIKFWQKYGKRTDELMTEEVVKNYPPETLTRVRRDLVIWGLLIPNKEIQEKRMELEASYHKPDYMKHYRIVWRDGVPYQVAC